MRAYRLSGLTVSGVWKAWSNTTSPLRASGASILLHDTRHLSAAALAWCLCAAAPAQGAGRDIAELSLEELAGIEVTSVSRRGEPLSAAPASIYVITADAIRRSGVSSLPEALRLAPNLQVARIDASQYAISARGFNNAIGNKLLVLVDGRTAYTPFFSGVFWDQQDVLLEDVERIEVISGPGATLWGANAVNGVINILTRSAADTQGTLVAGGGGNAERGVAVRHGVALGDSGHLRLYAKTTRLDSTERANGSDVPDGTQRHQAGLRADWDTGTDRYTLQGDAYRTRAEHRGFFGPFELYAIRGSGANLLGRWTRQLDAGGELRVQAYADHMERDDALLYRPRVDIADLELQHGFTSGAHKLVWGGGYRQAHDKIESGLFFGFVPESRTQRWTNLFVQDDLSLTPTLDLTLGLKLERNDFTGVETLPNLRLAWRASGTQLVWGALSRAVRAPARLDRDIRLPPNPPYIIAGGPEFDSERADVLELGYRGQFAGSWSVSATAYLSRWERLRSGQTPPDAQVQNMIDGKTYGAEAWATWQALPDWRLSAGFTTLKKELALRPESTDPVGPPNLGDDPSFQWSLRSSFNLDDDQSFELAVRRVASLPQADVPAYTAVDARYGWRLSRELELSVVGQNLFDPGHAEFAAAPGRSEIGRSIGVWLRWSL
jgi:iron complex outermembrane recepter protein